MDEEVNEQITQHISENISNKRKDTSKRKLVQVESTNQVGEPQESKNVKKKKRKKIFYINRVNYQRNHYQKLHRKYQN